MNLTNDVIRLNANGLQDVGQTDLDGSDADERVQDVVEDLVVFVRDDLC